MIKVDLSDGIRAMKEADKFLTGLKDRDIPYVQMTATNNLAFDAMETVRVEIGRELNIRKKKIPSSLRVKKATKQNPFALLYVDEWSWQYKALAHHFRGGDRERKGMEKAMIHLGLMHSKEILTPSPGVTIRPSTYVQMMSQIKLFYKAGFDANETDRSRHRNARKTKARFFVITGKSRSPLAPGVYARMPGHDGPVCMLRIAERPEYRKRIDMKDMVGKVYRMRGQKHVDDAMKRARAIRQRSGW
jgi:hypothetical protein